MIRGRLLAMVIAGAMSGAAASSAAAATWTVNTTADAAVSASECEGTPGDCSLRQAIDKAADGDIVSLPASKTPYAITLGAISIAKPLTIDGDGALNTKIEGNGGSQIFAVGELPSGSTLTLHGVTMSGGSQTINDDTTGTGGAIGIESPGATVTLTNDALSNNTAEVAGGAIELAAGTLRIARTTLGPGNIATSGDDSGSLGGAIDNDGGALRITDSTVSGNSAGTTDEPDGNGGGISTEGGGTTTLEYDTVAFNSATGSGGDLYSDNVGNDPEGFTVSESIVAGGGTPGGGGDCNGDAGFVSEGYNVTDGIASTGTATCGFTQATDVLGDARLGSLQDNGGQTDTEALAAGSPAINLIPTSNKSCTSTDQRGTARPQGSGCDAGALEAGGGETAPKWNPAHDFQTSPMENPSPDSLGNSNVWSYEMSPLADLHEPSNYTLLPTSGLGGGCDNLYSWTDDGGVPVVDFNALSTTITCGSVTVPAHTVVMHPAPSDDSIVAWTSPVSGTIAVAGSFESMDPNGGSGTTWYVDQNSTNLASGVNDVGGAGNFGMSSLTVSKGDVLYFILGPAANDDYTFGTTELNLTITEGPPPPPSADLSLTAQAQPNPVSVGQTLTDTFAVTNNGPDQSDGVSLSASVPSDATLSSAAASQGSCSGTSTVTCALGSLANGAQATVTVKLKPTKAGTVASTAKVTATTKDPNSANNRATATAQAVGGCATSMTLGVVEVLADCITRQSDGTYLAAGNTRFGDGASIADAGTATPATLILDPATHTISIAPASGGGEQSGELEAGGVDVATGELVIATEDVKDPVSGLSGSASVGGLSSVEVSLSGWTFGDLGIAPTVYLAPTGAGGGAIVDGQLMLPPWLGSVFAFGPFASSFTANVSGELSVQASSSGNVSVLNGGISFKASVLGDPSLQLAEAQLAYQRAGDTWTGSATLGMASLVGLKVDPIVISDGKLDELQASFSCAQSKICGTGSVPTLGTILDVKDVSLQMLNLQGVSYVPFTFGRPIFVCVPNRFIKKCPVPPPAPEVDGAIIAGVFDNRVIAGGSFTYLLDGAFSASGTVGLAPLYGGTFPDPAALQQNQSAQSVVNTLLSSAHTGVELAGASVNFTPPSLLQASGTVFLPPPPFPAQFLKGTISIGIDPPHFTGEGSLDLVVPSYVPFIGGDNFGGVEGLISDEAAAAEASTPSYCIKYIGCTPSISVLVAFDYQTGSFTWDIDGGNINDYATVPQDEASAARATNRRTVRVPSGKQLATFTIRSAKGTPNVRLISPRFRRHLRTLTLRSSKRLRNRTGGLAWVDKAKHTERFLVFLPRGGRWTVKRIRGPRIVSVTVTVPRHKLRPTSYPKATLPASDLPTGTVSTNQSLTLHYSVPRAPRGTTVELWAGTGPHGAGGTMIADGLPPSGSATWTPSGLPSGRYWPYAIVNENGIPVSIRYWPGSIELANPAAPPVPGGVQAVPNPGGAYVFWNEVATAATYAITATPAGGGTPVREAVPASQLADQLALAPGKWSVAVQAVDAAEHSSLPSAVAVVSVA